MGVKRWQSGARCDPDQSSVDSYEATTTCPSHQQPNPRGQEPAGFIPVPPNPRHPAPSQLC